MNFKNIELLSEEQVRQFVDWGEHVNKVLENPKLKTTLKSIANGIELFYQRQPYIQEMLLKEGWFVNPSLMPVDLYELEDRYNEEEDKFKKHNIVNEFFLECFPASELLNMLDKWVSDERLKDHKGVLTHMINEYVAKDYISSLHITVAKIEDLIVNLIMPDEGFVSHAKIKKKLTQTYDSIIPKEGVKQYLFGMGKSFLENEYFKSFDRKQEVTLSRHSISHGAYKGDYTQIDALRYILLYDLLYDSLK